MRCLDQCSCRWRGSKTNCAALHTVARLFKFPKTSDRDQQHEVDFSTHWSSRHPLRTTFVQENPTFEPLVLRTSSAHYGLHYKSRCSSRASHFAHPETQNSRLFRTSRADKSKSDDNFTFREPRRPKAATVYCISKTQTSAPCGSADLNLLTLDVGTLSVDTLFGEKWRRG